VTPTTVVHPDVNGASTFLSVYTIDAASNHLQETFLAAIGLKWSTQDLSASSGTPAAASGTSPVAVAHAGYTSVYTVNASDNHLQESYLPGMGQKWGTQDLSAGFHTPATPDSAAGVFHGGYTSVYSIDAASGHLQETYLPAIGKPWGTQDLTANAGTPPAQ
jgi:hypothetical protein